MLDPDQQPNVWLGEISSEALRVSEETLSTGEIAASAAHGLVIAAAPTPPDASADERRSHSALVRTRLRELLGEGVGETVSYTRGVTIMIGIQDPSVRLGVDIERLRPERERIVRRTLTDQEFVALGGESIPWIELLRAFCLKEAAYKALPADAQVGVGFRDLQIERSTNTTEVRLASNSLFRIRAATAVGNELLVAIAELG